MTKNRLYAEPCIYKVTSKSTGMCYIGQTIYPLKERKRKHFYKCKHDSYAILCKFHKAIVDQGEEDFTWEILEKVSIDLPPKEAIKELNRLEKSYIKKYNSWVKGYNSDAGGTNGYKSKASKEERLALRKQRCHERYLKKMADPDYRARLRQEQRDRRDADPEKHNKKQREYRSRKEVNEKLRNRQKRIYKTEAFKEWKKSYYLKNKEKIDKRRKAYKLAHRAEHAARCRARRAKKKEVK